MDGKKPSITEKYNSNLQRSIPAPYCPITQSKFAWYNHTCLPTPAKIEIHSSHILLNPVCINEDNELCHSKLLQIITKEKSKDVEGTAAVEFSGRMCGGNKANKSMYAAPASGMLAASTKGVYAAPAAGMYVAPAAGMHVAPAAGMH
eukprot:4232618-Ditylum_brightwellii.AAC.1